MARTLSILALIFAFIMPLVGLVLGVVALATKPEGEKDGLAIAALIVSVVWSGVVFIVFVAGIAAFGVFNPQRFAQEQCIGDSTKFACASNAISVNDSTGAMQFLLNNGAGESVNVTGVSTSTGGSCALSRWELLDPSSGTSIRGVAIRPNQNVVFEATCGPQKPGGVFQETFTIHYDVIGGVSGLSSSVEVQVAT